MFLGWLWAGYLLVVGYRSVIYGLAMGLRWAAMVWLWTNYGLAIDWLMAIYWLPIGFLSAIYWLSIGYPWTGYQMAIIWLLADCQQAIHWQWVGNWMVIMLLWDITYILADHGLAMG